MAQDDTATSIETFKMALGDPAGVLLNMGPVGKLTAFMALACLLVATGTAIVGRLNNAPRSVA